MPPGLLTDFMAEMFPDAKATEGESQKPAPTFASSAAEKTATKAESKPEVKPAEVAPDTKPVSAEPKTSKKIADFGEDAPKESDSTPKPGSKEYNWQELKTKAEAKEKEAAELSRQLAEYRAKYDGVPADIKAEAERLAKERDDLSARLEAVSLERHPKFEAHFKDGFDRISASLKEILPGENGERLAKIALSGNIKGSVAELDQILSDASPTAQSLIGAQLVAAQNLHGFKQSELAKASERWKQLQQENDAKQKGTMEQANRTFETVLAGARTNLDILKPRDGDDAWNSEIDARISQARDIYMGKDLGYDDLAKAAIWAAAAPAYQKTVIAQTEMIRRLNEQISKLQGAQPSVGGSGGEGSSGGSADSEDFTKSFMGVLNQSRK